EPSLEEFEQVLQKLKHFKTEYKNTEGLLLHFSMQLDKLYKVKVPAAPAPINAGKEKILTMINKGDLLSGFEELKKIFGDANDSLNELMNNYINPSNNFNQVQFLQRLRMFVLQNV
ncbi:MAG: hypothetical protein WCF67_14535, partial [Chitinophagaceae bacterium]